MPSCYGIFILWLFCSYFSHASHPLTSYGEFPWPSLGAALEQHPGCTVATRLPESIRAQQHRPSSALGSANLMAHVAHEEGGVDDRSGGLSLTDIPTLVEPDQS